MKERLAEYKKRAKEGALTIAVVGSLAIAGVVGSRPSIDAALAQEIPTATATLIGDIPPLDPEYRSYLPITANDFNQPAPTATPTLPPPVTVRPCGPDECETPTPKQTPTLLPTLEAYPDS